MLKYQLLRISNMFPHVENHANLQGLTLADSSLGSTYKIDALIGADKHYNFIVGDIVKDSAGPVMTKSKLG